MLRFGVATAIAAAKPNGSIPTIGFPPTYPNVLIPPLNPIGSDCTYRPTLAS